MLRIFSVLALMACATVAQAGVMATSSVSIEDFKITVNSGGFSNVDPANNSLLQNSLGGSFVSNGFGTLSAGPQVSTLGTSSFTTQSIGSGNALAPAGADISTTSIGDITDADPTSGFGLTSTGLSVDFNVSAPTEVTVSFDGTSSLSEVSTPGSGIASGTTDFEISLTGTGLGVPGGNLLLDLKNQADALDRNSFGTTGPLSFTQTLTLAPGSYGFTVQQSAVARVTAVPEPSTIIAFAGLGVLAFTRRRKLRAKNMK